ncbi:MAG: oligosaccharide flippase family protein [Nitrospirae bacterium]|nr:oligosaccharide flippase family protein [Nitrospirota bacterium]
MKKIFFSISQLAGMQIVVALTGIVRNKVLALRMGPAGFGEFSQMVAVASIVYALVSLGLGLGLGRNIAASRTPEERQRHLSTANFMVLAVSVASWLVIIPLFYRHDVLTSLGIKPVPTNYWAIGFLFLLKPLDALKGNYLAFLACPLGLNRTASGRSL